MHEHATITEGTKRYRHLTKQKAMQKQRKIATDGVWGGWGPDRPVLRLGGAVRRTGVTASIDPRLDLLIRGGFRDWNRGW